MRRSELKRLLDRVEETYSKSWSVLVSMKQFRLDPHNFFSFQGDLCEALNQLSAAYRAVHQERQALISRKMKVSPGWHRRRQSSLDKQQKAIVGVIGIGRALGDSFAWFFYQNNADLLREHSKHPLNRFMPPGLGGIGEKEFASKVRTIGSLMVLYHGTTTILRLGDVSLVDLKKMSVVALGEIKTSPSSPEKIAISFQFSGAQTDLKQFERLARRNREESAPSSDHLPPAIAARLKRQMKEITEAYKPKTSVAGAPSLQVHEERHVRDFEKLLQSSRVGRFLWCRLGPGLIYGVYRTRSSNLYARHLPGPTAGFASETDDLVPLAKEIMAPDSPHNELSVGTMLYSRTGMPRAVPGSIPLLWWPIDLELIRRVIFQEFLCVYIYNPAHLYNALESRGFTVLSAANGRGRRLRVAIGPATIEFEGLWYYIDLIVSGLFRESQVVNILGELAERIRQDPPSQSTRYDIAFNHRMLDLCPPKDRPTRRSSQRSDLSRSVQGS